MSIRYYVKVSRINKELLKSEKRYRTLHESMRDAFVSVDMQGRTLDFNNAYLQMLGYTEAEIRGLTYVDITPSRWHESEAKIVAEQILPRGYSDVYEKEYRKKDGTIIPVELRTVLIKDETGRPAFMWAIVRDITAGKKTAERIVRLNRLYSVLSRAKKHSSASGNSCFPMTLSSRSSTAWMPSSMSPT